MRALQVCRPAAGLAGVELVEVLEPVPAADEVVLAAAAVSANHLDRAVMAGAGLGRGVRLPRTLGIDPVGVVIECGTAVDPALLGRRVVVKPNVFCGVCRYCILGQEADCLDQWTLGVHRDGGAADRVAVPARAVIAAPDGIGDHTLAAAVHSVPIALHLVRVAAIDVPAGSGSDATVLVLGALGAVGSVLVQLAVAAGARVIAAVRTDAQHEAALALGAQAAISTVSTASTGGSDCVDQLRAVAPDGIDVAYDSTGDAGVLAVALAALAWRGTLITCAGRADARLAVDPGELYRRRQRIIGAAAADLRDVHDGLELVASGQVRVAEAGRFGLQDFREAYALLAERSRTGKVVFEVTQ